MKTFLLFATVATLIFTACQNNEATQKALHDEVIAKHDTLMAKMDEVITNKNKLESILTKLSTLKQEHITLDTNLLKLEIDSSKTALNIADDAMMSWMHNFNPDYSEKSHDEVIDYLNDQKHKIDSVKILFNSSLNHSNSLISKY
jgi:hypothetical protein